MTAPAKRTLFDTHTSSLWTRYAHYQLCTCSISKRSVSPSASFHLCVSWEKDCFDCCVWMLSSFATDLDHDLFKDHTMETSHALTSRIFYILVKTRFNLFSNVANWNAQKPTLLRGVLMKTCSSYFFHAATWYCERYLYGIWGAQ